MPDPLQALLAAGALPSTAFPPSSRYSGVELDAYDPGDGSPPIPFLRRRLCPPPEEHALLYEVTVTEGARRDLLAAAHLGDPELWWRLADANGVIDPRLLTDAVGRRLRITQPHGILGAPGE
jgi:hypothetical protein